MFHRLKVANNMNLSKIYFLLCPSDNGGCLMLFRECLLMLQARLKLQLFDKICQKNNTVHRWQPYVNMSNVKVFVYGRRY